MRKNREMNAQITCRDSSQGLLAGHFRKSGGTLLKAKHQYAPAILGKSDERPSQICSHNILRIPLKQLGTVQKLVLCIKKVDVSCVSIN